MHLVLSSLVILQMCIFQCSSEWVKISQTSDDNQNESARNDQDQLKVIKDANDPSPEWIEYQKERFKGSNFSQKLVISGETHLKTSAEVIVPAQINDSNLKRNKIVRMKTKITLHDPEADQRTTTTEAPYHAPKKPKPTKPTYYNQDIKFPSFMGFLKFLTSLQKGLLKKNSFGIMDKIKMLKSMRDQLMMNIENSFGSMFPKSRQKRGLTDESSFQFPPETALMSISFLTFSVFLIKLVLQVIHIIKSKHYAYNTMTMSNMTAMTKSGLNARKFGESHEDLEIVTKISEAIKSNPFNAK